MNEPHDDREQSPPRDRDLSSRQFDLPTLFAAMTLLCVVFGSLYSIHRTTWDWHPRILVSADMLDFFWVGCKGVLGYHICCIWILVRLGSYRPLCWSLVWFILLVGLPLFWTAFRIQPANLAAWFVLLWTSAMLGIAEVRIRRLRHHFLMVFLAILVCSFWTAGLIVLFTQLPER